jgi:hypothetical protein
LAKRTSVPSKRALARVNFVVLDQPASKKFPKWKNSKQAGSSVRKKTDNTTLRYLDINPRRGHARFLTSFRKHFGTTCQMTH